MKKSKAIISIISKVYEVGMGSGKNSDKVKMTDEKENIIGFNNSEQNVFDDSFPEEIKMQVVGNMAELGEKINISYHESNDMGFENTKTLISFEKSNPTCVTMTRRGGDCAAMYFDKSQKRRMCGYNMGAMHFDMTFITQDVINGITSHGGQMYLDYSIENNGTAVQRVCMDIDVKPIEG